MFAHIRPISRTATSPPRGRGSGSPWRKPWAATASSPTRPAPSEPR